MCFDENGCGKGRKMQKNKCLGMRKIWKFAERQSASAQACIRGARILRRAIWPNLRLICEGVSRIVAKAMFSCYNVLYSLCYPAKWGRIAIPSMRFST